MRKSLSKQIEYQINDKLTTVRNREQLILLIHPHDLPKLKQLPEYERGFIGRSEFDGIQIYENEEVLKGHPLVVSKLEAAWKGKVTYSDEFDEWLTYNPSVYEWDNDE